MLLCIAVFMTGGILFVAALYTTKDGQHFGSSARGKKLFESMHTPWKHLHQEGKISKVNDSCIFS